MTDIFREVEEDVRRERFEKFFKAYGNYLIAGLVLLFAGIGGFEFWQAHQQKLAAAASGRFMAAQRISTPKEAAAAYTALSQDAPGGYQTVARLSQANALSAAGKNADALAIYKPMAADGSVIGAVARLRAAWLMADTSPRKELADWLAPLNDPANAWRQMAQEVLAYADYRAGDTLAAMTKFGALGNDAQAPDALRARAHAMMSLLSQGGIKESGAVPPPATLPPAGMAAQ